jgi:hypothetical protein
MRNKAAIVVAVVLAAGLAQAMQFTDWGPAASVESIPGTSPAFNTVSQDGCPAPSRDGLTFYMASNRPGGYGGLDIWVAQRESADDPWGDPVNLGPVINTAADEFCPGPLRNGHGLLFVSTRAGGCGLSDMYLSRYHKKRGWQPAENLGCAVNSAADEASPMLVEYDNGVTEFYFSSTRAGGVTAEPPGAIAGDSDIYVAPVAPDGSIGAPVPAPGLNTAAGEFRPHVRRDGLEIFFDSNAAGGFGGLDIWTAVRDSTSFPWLPALNAGSNINSASNETRPYLSWGASTLYFGTTRAGVEGVGDIWFTTRVKQTGQ